ARGVYQLDGLGEYAGPIIGWMKSKEKIVKTVFPRLGNLLEWVHKEDFTSSIKSAVGTAKNIGLPESALPKGGGKFLPISSEIITLVGMNENDYREFEEQGLVFLKQVIQKHGECGNLSLKFHNGKILWLCKEHQRVIEAETESRAIAAERRLGKLW